MLNELERNCIDAYRRREPQNVSGDDEISRWVAFGLYMLLDAGRLVREKRMVAGREDVLYRDDGSPATRLEAHIESLLRNRLTKFEPNATVIGEETGGKLPSSGVVVAIDPVDGTWAFLTGTETYTTTLAGFLDGKPQLGMVSNPTTGEIGYATRDGAARLLQLSVFGEPDAACTLPEYRAKSENVLVNFHPHHRGGALVGALYEAWQERGVRMVRSPGGSPAWALLEAARGNFVYLNLWSKRPAQPYDLAAAVLLEMALNLSRQGEVLFDASLFEQARMRSRVGQRNRRLLRNAGQDHHFVFLEGFCGTVEMNDSEHLAPCDHGHADHRAELEAGHGVRAGESSIAHGVRGENAATVLDGIAYQGAAHRDVGRLT